MRAPGTQRATDERAAKFKLGNQVKSWFVRAAGSARRSPPAGEGPHTPRPRGAGPSGYSCAEPAGPGGVPVPRENRSLSPPARLQTPTRPGQGSSAPTGRPLRRAVESREIQRRRLLPHRGHCRGGQVASSTDRCTAEWAPAPRPPVNWPGTGRGSHQVPPPACPARPGRRAPPATGHVCLRRQRVTCGPAGQEKVRPPALLASAVQS